MPTVLQYGRAAEREMRTIWWTTWRERPREMLLVAGTSQAEIFQPSGVGMAGVIAPGLSSKTLCLIKVDSQGNGQWAKSIGSSLDGPYNLISGATACSRITDEIIWAGDFSGSLNLVSPAI